MLDTGKDTKCLIGDVLEIKLLVDVENIGMIGDKKIAIVLSTICDFRMLGLLFCGHKSLMLLYLGYEFSVVNHLNRSREQ